MKVYRRLAGLLNARDNCILSNNTEWVEKHEESLNNTVREYLPHGSGIDSGCQIDLDKSNDNRLVICSEYHAMNENGYYDGWYGFHVTVKPSLQFGFNLKITGNMGKYNDVKDYLYDVFDFALRGELTKE